MTTNYFPTLEIPLELQLKLSELIVAPTATSSYYAAGTWTPTVTNIPGNTATVVRKAYLRQGIGPAAAEGDTIMLDLLITFECIGNNQVGCILDLPVGFDIGPTGATANAVAYDANTEEPFPFYMLADESTPGQIGLYTLQGFGGSVTVTAAIRVFYFAA